MINIRHVHFTSTHVRIHVYIQLCSIHHAFVHYSICGIPSRCMKFARHMVRPCAYCGSRGWATTMQILSGIYYTMMITNVPFSFYRRVYIYTAILSERMFFQFGSLYNNRCLTNNWKFFWKLFYVVVVHDRLFFYIVCPNEAQSDSSFHFQNTFSLCGLRVWFVDIYENDLKLPGPFPSTHLCMRLGIAMSRLHRSGSKLKCNIASASDTQSRISTDLERTPNVRAHCYKQSTLLLFWFQIYL